MLAELLPAVVAGLRSEKNMRWNAPGLSFTRPIRWILALLGEAVVPFPVSNLASGRETWVHRNADAPVVDGQLRRGVPAGARRERHRARHRRPPARRSSTGARSSRPRSAAVVDVDGRGDVVDEVTNLVETPNPLLGSFEERYLELPPDILVTVMRKHQRYLPVRDADGALRRYFVAVANGDVRRRRWSGRQRGRAPGPVRGRGVLLARRPAGRARGDSAPGSAS